MGGNTFRCQSETRELVRRAVLVSPPKFANLNLPRQRSYRQFGDGHQSSTVPSELVQPCCLEAGRRVKATAAMVVCRPAYPVEACTSGLPLLEPSDGTEELSCGADEILSLFANQRDDDFLSPVKTVKNDDDGWHDWYWPAEGCDWYWPTDVDVPEGYDYSKPTCDNYCAPGITKFYGQYQVSRARLALTITPPSLSPHRL